MAIFVVLSVCLFLWGGSFYVLFYIIPVVGVFLFGLFIRTLMLFILHFFREKINGLLLLII